jgi:hypothetical protein
MPYKLTKKIPIPDKKRNSYPFRKMDVGDSFLVPFDNVRDQNNIRSAASHFARRTGLAQFTITVEQHGYRVFRIA